MERDVRKDRTGWRDESISLRHREWGFNCPAVDLDFLVVEYNFGKPVALIEYKHYKYDRQNLNTNHATYRALLALADAAVLPFAVAVYWPDTWAFCIKPVNDLAMKWFSTWEPLTEREYVERLYAMRSMIITKELAGKLHGELPPMKRSCQEVTYQMV